MNQPPSFGAPAGGFSFGAPGTAAPAASTPGTGGFSFGTPAPAAAVPAPLGGSGFSFGSTPAPAASTAAPVGGGFGFGAPAASAPAPATGGFTFGTPAAPASTAPAPAAGGFSLGTTPAAPAATASAPTLGGSGFSFGASTTPGTAPTAAVAPTPAGGFSFGATPAAATAGATPAPTSGMSFGATPTASTTTTTQATTASGPTGGISFGAPAAAATTAAATPSGSGFSFGTPGAITSTTAATTTTAPTGGFSFGTPAATTTTTPATGGFSFGATTAAPSATTTTAETAAAPSLGGISLAKGTGMPFKPEGKAVLDLPVPPEILQIVEELKTHIKNQKVKMSEVCNASDKNIDKVTEEVESTRLEVSNLTNQCHRLTLFCNSLMKDMQQELKYLDMAMVTKDTPLALQNENTAPTNYFFNLVAGYNEKMITYKREIERAETALASLGHSRGFSHQDLIHALKRTQETVINMAARVQDLHERVMNELAVNRNLRRFPVDGNESAVRGGGRPVGGASFNSGLYSFY